MTFKWGGLIALLLAVPALSAAPGRAAPLLRGDMDRDGRIDVGDAIRILRITVGLDAGAPVDVVAGDVDPVPGEQGRVYGDGSLTVGDAVRLLRYVVGLMDVEHFYGGETATIDPDAPTLQVNTLSASPILFHGTAGADAPLSVNVVGAQGMSMGGFTLSVRTPEGAPPLRIIGVDRGGLLPDGTEILTNPSSLPTEGVSSLRVAFNAAGLSPVNGYGELIRLTLRPAAPPPPAAVYTIVVTGPDFTTVDAATLPVPPLEKPLSDDD